MTDNRGTMSACRVKAKKLLAALGMPSEASS
jgi:hypothetical protein